MPFPTDDNRDKPWLMRTYAGHSSAKESNELYRRNLAKGQTGLSVAFDLPTQTGYDPDAELARGEVGKVGVPISHIGDVRTLFDGIPMEQMNTSMTINAPAMYLLALYLTVAEEHGADFAQAVRHDAERHHQGVPVARDVRVPAGAVDAADHRHDRLHGGQRAEVEPDQRLQLPPAGGRRDAGAGGRVRAVHRDRGAGLGARLRPGARRRSSARSSPASRSSSTPACASSRRCASCARSASCGTRSRASATASRTPKHRRFRYGVQVNSLGLTEAQPENNVYRILLEMLAVTMSQGRARAGRPAAGLERGAGPAARLGPAVVAAHAAGARLRVRPARVRRPVRGVQGRRGQGRRHQAGRAGRDRRRSSRWAARSRPSSPAT